MIPTIVLGGLTKEQMSIHQPQKRGKTPASNASRMDI